MRPRRLGPGRLLAASCTALILLPAATAAAGVAPVAQPRTTTPIKHFVVLMQENHSFDNYFGTYPGADGIPKDVCMAKSLKPGANPHDCVRPFRLGNNPTADLLHNKSVARRQLNGGKMNGFVSASRLKGTDRVNPDVMAHYDDRDLPYYWNIADNYVLFDRFFTSSLAGSMTNHMYWVTGTPGVTSATSERIPDDGFSVPTIFDRLEAAGISWKFYVQNYDPRITYRSREVGDRGSQIIWVPLLNYARFLDSPKLFSKIVDAREYYEDLDHGTLPAVSFFAPSGSSEHPPGSVQAGQAFVRTLINSAMRSSAWSSMAFMWTYDDWGGWYDHVRPPRVDRYGLGFRAPALLVSPYAKKGLIDHTTLDFTSMLKFIEDNWRLEPLASRDRKANSIAGAFDFTRGPRRAAFIGLERREAAQPQPKRWIVYLCYLLALVAAALLWTVAHRSDRRAARAREPHDRTAEESGA